MTITSSHLRHTVYQSNRHVGHTYYGKMTRKPFEEVTIRSRSEAFKKKMSGIREIIFLLTWTPVGGLIPLIFNNIKINELSCKLLFNTSMWINMEEKFHCIIIIYFKVHFPIKVYAFQSYFSLKLFHFGCFARPHGFSWRQSALPSTEVSTCSRCHLQVWWWHRWSISLCLYQINFKLNTNTNTNTFRFSGSAYAD